MIALRYFYEREKWKKESIKRVYWNSHSTSSQMERIRCLPLLEATWPGSWPREYKKRTHPEHAERKPGSSLLFSANRIHDFLRLVVTKWRIIYNKFSTKLWRNCKHGKGQENTAAMHKCRGIKKGKIWKRYIDNLIREKGSWNPNGLE